MVCVCNNLKDTKLDLTEFKDGKFRATGKVYAFNVNVELPEIAPIK